MDCCNLGGGKYDHHGTDSYDTANGMDCCNDRCLAEGNREHRSYDTANGMDCCNCHPCSSISGILALRYRERYGLLQLDMDVELSIKDKRYDTANGMDCCNIEVIAKNQLLLHMLRYRERYGLLQLPDACWYVAGTTLRYRERYGLLQPGEPCLLQGPS